MSNQVADSLVVLGIIFLCYIVLKIFGYLLEKVLGFNEKSYNEYGKNPWGIPRKSRSEKTLEEKKKRIN